jgi:AcrR family transcriptional regulator
MAFQPASKTKEELVKAFRRSEILDAARHVFGEHGIGEISMERIAQQAGVAKGTLYLYFESKDALLENVLEFAYQEFIQRCRQAADGASGYTEKIRAIAISIVESNAEHRAFGQALQERPELGPEGASPFSERLREQILPFVDFVADLFERGTRAGEFRAIGGMRAARLFLSLMRGLTLQQLREPDPPSAAEELEVLLDVFLRGIAAEARPR